MKPTIRSVLAAALVLPIELYNNVELHLQACELASRYNLPAAYDAHYLALAEYLGAEMYTMDKKLINAMGSDSPTWLHLLA